MPAARHLEVEKFCTQIDATIEEIQALPSGLNVVKRGQKISRTLQGKLHRELQEKRVQDLPGSPGNDVDPEPTAVSDASPKAQTHDDRNPQTRRTPTVPVPRPPGAAPRPPAESRDRTQRSSIGDPGGPVGASEPGARQVRDIAQECPAPVARVLAALNELTGAEGWTPNSYVPVETIEPLKQNLAQGASAPTQRSAGAARVAKLPRSLDELNAVRICVLSERLTPGERYLAEALRGLEGCVAFVGPHVPKDDHHIYGQCIEIDAIVMTPTFLAVIEVKDTTATGLVKPALNGAWMVGDQVLHDGNSFPTDQVLRQAKVLKGLMKDLSGMPRIPGFVAIHGDGVRFADTPFVTVAGGECFASKSTDIVEAIASYQSKTRPRITVDKVLRVMTILDLGEPQRMNRQELGLLGFAEDFRAID